MATLSKRNKAAPLLNHDEDASKFQPKKANAKNAKNAKSNFTVKSFCSSLALLVLMLLATSYIVTDTLSFGYTVPNIRKFVPPTQRTFTLAELKQYDGTDPEKPIYLSIMGKVFDVTNGRDFYGPGGGYHFFAGTDATRAYITGCFKTHLTHDLRGLTDAEIQQAVGWRKFYEDSPKYWQVGTLELPEIDPNSPVPEPCQGKQKPT